MEWIDITVPLREGMVHWPGDAPVQVKRLRSIGESDTLTLSELYIKNRDGQNVIMLAASVYGDGGVVIFSNDGEQVAHLVGDNGNGMLYLYNSYGEIVAKIGASSSSGGILSLIDKYGESTFAAP